VNNTSKAVGNSQFRSGLDTHLTCHSDELFSASAAFSGRWSKEEEGSEISQIPTY